MHWVIHVILFVLLETHNGATQAALQRFIYQLVVKVRFDLIHRVIEVGQGSNIVFGTRFR